MFNLYPSLGKTNSLILSVRPKPHENREYSQISHQSFNFQVRQQDRKKKKPDKQIQKISIDCKLKYNKYIDMSNV
jgi:hypothetical protein